MENIMEIINKILEKVEWKDFHPIEINFFIKDYSSIKECILDLNTSKLELNSFKGIGFQIICKVTDKNTGSLKEITLFNEQENIKVTFAYWLNSIYLYKYC